VPSGRIRAGEYLALNPGHGDRSPGSFSINMRLGRWADFSSGDKGGAVASLIAFLENCSQVEAARLLAKMLGIGAGRKDARHGFGKYEPPGKSALQEAKDFLIDSLADGPRSVKKTLGARRPILACLERHSAGRKRTLEFKSKRMGGAAAGCGPSAEIVNLKIEGAHNSRRCPTKMCEPIATPGLG
jgi:hypothetical protein